MKVDEIRRRRRFEASFILDKNHPRRRSDSWRRSLPRGQQLTAANYQKQSIRPAELERARVAISKLSSRTIVTVHRGGERHCLSMGLVHELSKGRFRGKGVIEAVARGKRNEETHDTRALEPGKFARGCRRNAQPAGRHVTRRRHNWHAPFPPSFHPVGFRPLAPPPPPPLRYHASLSPHLCLYTGASSPPRGAKLSTAHCPYESHLSNRRYSWSNTSVYCHTRSGLGSFCPFGGSLKNVGLSLGEARRSLVLPRGFSPATRGKERGKGFWLFLG